MPLLLIADPPAACSLVPIAGPKSGQLADPLGRAAVDGRPDYREDRALQRCRRQDLPPAIVGVGGLRRLVLPGSEFPYPLEDRPGQDPADYASGHAERLVEDLHHRCLMRRTSQPARSTAVAVTASWTSRRRIKPTARSAVRRTGSGAAARALTTAAATWPLAWPALSATCSLTSAALSWARAFTSTLAARACTVSPSSSRVRSISRTSASASRGGSSACVA